MTWRGEPPAMVFGWAARAILNAGVDAGQSMHFWSRSCDLPAFYPLTSACVSPRIRFPSPTQKAKNQRFSWQKCTGVFMNKGRLRNTPGVFPPHIISCPSSSPSPRASLPCGESGGSGDKGCLLSRSPLPPRRRTPPRRRCPCPKPGSCSLVHRGQCTRPRHRKGNTGSRGGAGGGLPCSASWLFS